MQAVSPVCRRHPSPRSVIFFNCPATYAARHDCRCNREDDRADADSGGSGGYDVGGVPEDVGADAGQGVGLSPRRRTHRAVCEWSKANGYRLAGPRWEIYGDPDPSAGHFDVDVFWALVAP